MARGARAQTQNARPALLSLARLVLPRRTASCCLKARFSRASSRRGPKLDRTLASRAYSKGSIKWGQPDPERKNVNDYALHGVPRRHSPAKTPFAKSRCNKEPVTSYLLPSDGLAG